MINRLTTAGIALMLTLPAAALAQGAKMDADGDGTVTQSEFQKAYPDMKDGTFSSIDADANGALSEAEIAEARDAGLLPGSMSEG